MHVNEPKNVVIVTSKPSISRFLQETLHPEARRAYGASCIIHHVYLGGLGGLYEFKLGHVLPLSGVPFVSEPAYRASRHLRLAPRRFDEAVAIELAPTVEASLELLCLADVVLIAADPDHRDDAAAWLLCAELKAGCETRYLSPAMIRLPPVFAALEEAPLLGPESGRVAYGLAKRFFDYNHLVNALPTMGYALSRAGLAPGYVSKYMLLLLWHLWQAGPASEQELLTTMERWTGSGKYPPGRLGSAVSRCELLSRLKATGLASLEGGRLGVTPAGGRFLQLLGKDSFDPDLPMRLEGWCELGGGSRPAMERYLKTYFGRLARRLAR